MGKLLQLKKSPPNRAALIDEFGEVTRRRDEFAPTERRYQQLRAEIASWYEDKPAAEDFIDKGERYELRVGPRENQRKPNVKAIFKRLGAAKFLAIATVTLKALETVFGKNDIAELVTEDRTGSRSLTATPITPVPAMIQEPAA